MKEQWEILIIKINRMSLRERLLIFFAIAAVLFWVTKSLLLDPLLVEQKKLTDNMLKQQDSLKIVESQVEVTVKARRDVENSPLRKTINQAKEQLADGDLYLQGLRSHLVEPEKIPGLLEQVLHKNSRLQLINLQTLSDTPALDPLLEKELVNSVESKSTAENKAGATEDMPASAVVEANKRAFKHGVKIALRGNYLDLLQYLAELEQLPAQMYWGMVEMKVEKYPDVEMTLTVYTLSLDKIWLKI